MRWPSCIPTPRPNCTTGRRSSCSSPRCCRRSPPTHASTWSRRRCSRAIPTPAALAGADAAGARSASSSPPASSGRRPRPCSRMARLLVEHHGGQVPADMDALTALPGVGRKTANVVLGHALGVPGLPVDRHVLRVANRIGLAEGDDPVEVESQLCARAAAGALDAGVGRADPARPPRLQAEAAVRPSVRCRPTTAPTIAGGRRATAAPQYAANDARRGPPHGDPGGVRAAGHRGGDADSRCGSGGRSTNLALVVEDEPSPELLASMEIEPPDSLYGLYEGTPLTERAWAHGNVAARPHHHLPAPDRRRLRGRGRGARRDRRDADPRGRSLLRPERGRDRGHRGAGTGAATRWARTTTSRDAASGLARSQPACLGRASVSASTSSSRPGSPRSWTRLEAGPTDRFIEIGPGRGALTRPLAPRVAELVAVEIDRDLAAHLARRPAPPHVRVVTAISWTVRPPASLVTAHRRSPYGSSATCPTTSRAPILFRLFAVVAGGAGAARRHGHAAAGGGRPPAGRARHQRVRRAQRLRRALRRTSRAC